jgi:hypothetical protein
MMRSDGVLIAFHQTYSTNKTFLGKVRRCLLLKIFIQTAFASVAAGKFQFGQARDGKRRIVLRNVALMLALPSTAIENAKDATFIFKVAQGNTVLPNANPGTSSQITSTLVLDRERASTRARKIRWSQVKHEPYKDTDIFERDGYICGICGEATDKTTHPKHPDSPTIDHVIPLTKCGDDVPTNVQCAHYGCNSRKSDKILSLF